MLFNHAYGISQNMQENGGNRGKKIVQSNLDRSWILVLVMALDFNQTFT